MIKAAILGLLWLPMALMAKELPINTKLGGDFELMSSQGARQKLSEYQGKVVLLNFGYTSCPDICPVVLNRMAKVMNELSDARKNVVPIFITFDPKRDTVDRLLQYLNHFGKEFVGFTGKATELQAVARQYGVVAIEQKSGSAAVLYTHSDYIYLLDQKGRVRALFNKEDTIGKMTGDIKGLLNE